MRLTALVQGVVALAFPFAAWAQSSLPSGANVTAGSASISTTASSTTVTTGSQRTVINWDTFNVGAGNSVRFNQPSTSSATLNRVIGSDGSVILGSVTSNGQIFLVNPNGIFVGPGGSFSGSSVYLSTGNISNADFLGGNIRFDPPPSGSSIRFEGSIDATDVFRFNADLLDIRETVNNPGGTIPLTGQPPTLPGGSIVLSPGGNLGVSSAGNVSLSAGSVVVSGSATVASSGGTVTVQQSSSSAIINWNQFSIGAGQTVNFSQPSSSSVALNRVTNSDPRAIFGQLTSNGRVFLINPAGILVSPAGTLATGSLKLAAVATPPPASLAGPAISPPPRTPPSVAPRAPAGLVDGTVTVRVSLVDVGSIALR